MKFLKRKLFWSNFLNKKAKRQMTSLAAVNIKLCASDKKKWEQLNSKKNLLFSTTFKMESAFALTLGKTLSLSLYLE